MFDSGQSFEMQVRPRLVFGAGRIAELGELAKSLGARRALVVSDPGIVAAGHVQRGIDSLVAAGVSAELFDGAAENPTTEHVTAGVEVAKKVQPDLLIGLGGGSSLDCAKGINFIYSCGGTMQDYWGVGKARGDMLPMIAVPTTAGTGSEMQSFALISDAKTHVKMACGDPRAACRIALLDPELTLTQPPDVTALTCIDALSHAVETYVTRRRNPVSTLFSREAFRLIAPHIGQVFNDPSDLSVRAALHLGAAYAGIAIEHSMLGAAHALANPLTATYGTPHGQAVGMMLPHVVRFNGEQFGDWYNELWSAAEFDDAAARISRSNNGNAAASAVAASLVAVGQPARRGDVGQPTSSPRRETQHYADQRDSGRTEHSGSGTQRMAGFIHDVLQAAELPRRLRDCGIDPNALDQLAADAATQWTGKFNPREVDQNALRDLYQAAF